MRQLALAILALMLAACAANVALDRTIDGGQNETEERRAATYPSTTETAAPEVANTDHKAAHVRADIAAEAAREVANAG